MKDRIRPALAVALLLLTGAGRPDTIEEIAWLSGGWSETRGERWTEEHWTAPRAGAMLGVGRAGQGATMRSFEHMRIARDEEGALAFFGSPGGAPPVAFKLVRAGPREVVFVNAAHDFPQRVHYRRDGEELLAEASDLARKQVLRWRYRKLSR